MYTFLSFFGSKENARIPDSMCLKTEVDLLVDQNDEGTFDAVNNQKIHARMSGDFFISNLPNICPQFFTLGPE